MTSPKNPKLQCPSGHSGQHSFHLTTPNIQEGFEFGLVPIDCKSIVFLLRILWSDPQRWGGRRGWGAPPGCPSRRRSTCPALPAPPGPERLKFYQSHNSPPAPSPGLSPVYTRYVIQANNKLQYLGGMWNWSLEMSIKTRCRIYGSFLRALEAARKIKMCTLLTMLCLTDGQKDTPLWHIMSLRLNLAILTPGHVIRDYLFNNSIFLHHNS